MLSLRGKDMVCQQAVELVTGYLEGSSVAPRTASVRSPPSRVPNCTAYLEQMKMTIALTGSVEPEDLSPEARAELSDLFRRWRTE